jgi:hypothetical protein
MIRFGEYMVELLGPFLDLGDDLKCRYLPNNNSLNYEVR